MTDTHINAYEQDVAETQQEVDAAKAKLEAAKLRLAEKKKADGVEDVVQETPASLPQGQTQDDSDKEDRKGLLGKKK